MFDALAERFEGIFTRLRSRGRLSERDVEEVTREIRLALLEADVHVRVTRELVRRVRERATGAEVRQSLTPAQQVIKIVHEELVTTLGGLTGRLVMSDRPPTVVMLCGLQGSGKTTCAAKLARHLRREGLAVLLVAADLQRPAAVEQLRVLAERIEVPVLGPEPGESDPVGLCARARDEAARRAATVVIVDTAGRLQVDDALMDELRAVRAVLDPTDTVLVVDAMTGQEAVNVAGAFDAAVQLDGVILTKVDGDARGGAALSVKEVVGRPILFVGVGEKLEDFEPFHPDRMASRILGMGDVLTLIEKAEAAFDAEEAKVAEAKLREGQFTLEDFLAQMRQVRKMGPLSNLLKLLPGMPKEMRQAEIDERSLARVEAIICSMTPAERRNPAAIDGSRRLRIARGAGVTTSEVNALLKQFKLASQMMRSMTQGRRSRSGVPRLDPAATLTDLPTAGIPGPRPR